MSYKVSEREFTKAVGRAVKGDDGKRKVPTTKVKLQVPQLDIASIRTLEDIFSDCKAILAQDIPGFRDVSSFVELFNVGAVASLQKSLKTGADVRRSQTQNTIFKSYLELVRIGAMSAGPNDQGKPDALELLAMANMGDARGEFLAAVESMDDNDDDDEETSVAGVSNTQRSA